MCDCPLAHGPTRIPPKCYDSDIGLDRLYIVKHLLSSADAFLALRNTTHRCVLMWYLCVSVQLPPRRGRGHRPPKRSKPRFC